MGTQQVSGDRLGLLLVNGEKSGRMVDREAEESELKLEPTGTSDHTTSREGGCC